MTINTRLRSKASAKLFLVYVRVTTFTKSGFLMIKHKFPRRSWGNYRKNFIRLDMTLHAVNFDLSVSTRNLELRGIVIKLI